MVRSDQLSNVCSLSDSPQPASVTPRLVNHGCQSTAPPGCRSTCIHHTCPPPQAHAAIASHTDGRHRVNDPHPRREQRAHVHGRELAGSLFGASLLPWLAMLYWLKHPKTQAPKGVCFGLTYLLAFVFGSIPAAIGAGALYGASLADADWLHGAAPARSALSATSTASSTSPTARAWPRSRAPRRARRLRSGRRTRSRRS